MKSFPAVVGGESIPKTKDGFPPKAAGMTTVMFDVNKIRSDFPIFSQKVYGKPLVYLDNAATSQAPQTVLNAMNHFYTEIRSNVHRGVHHLSERSTEAYEGARVKIQKFIGAASEKEIIFVRGATEAINLVAASFGRKNLKAGDEIIISTMEHHSNIVPWQMVADATGAKLRIIPINDRGELLLDEYKKLLGPKTKLVAVTHVSNALGTINPIKEIIRLAHAHNSVVLIDGAQSTPHLKINVTELDCDFFVFSGHKVYGPTGIGILYGKEKLLEAMDPYQGGGDMIRSVTFEKTTYNDLPYKFEAGTPNIAGAIGLGAAIGCFNDLDFEGAKKHEEELLIYGTKRLKEIPGLKIIGEADNKISILSFTMNEAHPHDIATILDHEGVAIRAGHHCTQPLMKRLGLTATARASLAFYNTKEEVDVLVKGLKKIVEVFG